MADIFLSYAREDAERARRYAEAFLEIGWSVFWDPQILPGSTWDEVIEDEITQCKCVVVLWSAVSVKKTWVKNEASHAEQRGVLVPVAIDRIELPLAFRHRQSAQLQEWKGSSKDAGFAQLLKAIARQILSFHIPGDFIDLEGAILNVADHNVQALSRCELALVPVEAVRKLANEHPMIARAMWVDALVDSSIFREWVVNVGRRDARSRIAHLLCELAVRLDDEPRDGSVFALPLTQEHIADATGLTSVHTNRTIQSLRREGLISLASGRLVIHDWNALRSIGDFSELYLHRELDRGAGRGLDLGCAYVDAGRLADLGALHPTWTHGSLVQRSLSGVTRASWSGTGSRSWAGRPPSCCRV